MLETVEFEKTYRRNFERLFLIAAKIVGEDQARDIVHDVFIKVYDMKTLPNNIDAYLAVAVRNRSLTALQQMTSFQLIENALPLSDENDEFQFPSADELRGLVDNELSPKVQATVCRVFFEGDSYKQAAEVLDVSVATIHKHVVTALKKLRSILKPQTK